MVGIIIVSHGNYAEALYESIKMLHGEQEKIETINFKTGESTEDLKEKINSAKDRLKTEYTLILVDILGGSPYNVSSLEIDEKVNVITGFNMPMLLDIISRRNEPLGLISKAAKRAGKNGIVDVKEKLSEKINK
ncbi:PTS system, mannose-specific IIA component [Caloramator quimbayensis]|uniref:PTS system, mannose-specific IIA component n=1 Tax=Caloramator quimbayensis TaxID=1147123 RepID=A0A1T4WMW3_9CLOT|nr:PTS sugar transporter subunit IIA [Caloramator quimbayensis]SKA78477.1 PTS system, mannose-specific IIA component [Caloramator quimbayensis]